MISRRGPDLAVELALRAAIVTSPASKIRLERPERVRCGGGHSRRAAPRLRGCVIVAGGCHLPTQRIHHCRALTSRTSSAVLETTCHTVLSLIPVPETVPWVNELAPAPCARAPAGCCPGRRMPPKSRSSSRGKSRGSSRGRSASPGKSKRKRKSKKGKEAKAIDYTPWSIGAINAVVAGDPVKLARVLKFSTTGEVDIDEQIKLVKGIDSAHSDLPSAPARL